MVRGYYRRESYIRVPSIPSDLIAQSENVMRERMKEYALNLARSAPKNTVAFTGVLHEGIFTVGLAQKDSPGYWPMFFDTWEGGVVAAFPTYDAAADFADEMNKELGLTKLEAFHIVTSSMRMK